MPDRPDFTSMLVGFTTELRGAGLTVGSGDVLMYCAAAAAVDVTDLVDLYWAGRCTLVTRREQVPAYHRTFVAYYLGSPDESPGASAFTVAARAEAVGTLQIAETERLGEEVDEQEAELGYAAARASTMKAKSFAACTPEELAVLRRILRTMQLAPPRRRTRRTAPTRHGRMPDLRRTVRESMRLHGEPGALHRRRRRLRTRRLTLLLDVSGSMADYSRNLVQFAHTSSRASTRTEVFCFGTRLTRITRELEHRRPDLALDRAAAAVTDWEGGTRIGSCLDEFVRRWARRGMTRGGIVVICSDGLDRGDPELLESAMQRLSRLCHRIVWLNPHKGHRTDFTPDTLGMMVAEPYVDQLLSGHDLASLSEFAHVLASLR
ncbi:MAG TPA: VWA domain-containing protein [Nocardioides sp.]|nr:VWA domain-containing protein [Nocardioides sp.]